MLSQSDQRRILKQDSLRRQERELRETAQLVGITLPTQDSHARAPYAHVNPELVRGIGVVSPPPKVRASERWTGTLGTQAHRSGRTIGVAPGTESTVPTVRVIRNGVETIEPASRFGRSRTTGKRHSKTTVRTVPETARIASDPRYIRAMADGSA